jgi:hypothetical protein
LYLVYINDKTVYFILNSVSESTATEIVGLWKNPKGLGIVDRISDQWLFVSDDDGNVYAATGNKFKDVAQFGVMLELILLFLLPVLLLQVFKMWSTCHRRFMLFGRMLRIRASWNVFPI